MAYSPLPPLGQTTKSASLPVTVASDQGNLAVNAAQIAGTTTDTNSGVKSAGTLRVVLATDQPALTNKLLVTPDSVALPANQSVNNSQINGVTPLMGNGATGTGSQRVTIASDNTAFAVNSNLQAGSNLVGKVGIDQTTPGTTNAVNSTPATPTPYSLSSAATTNLATVKASAGTLYTVAASNNGAAAAFLKLYNLAVNPTLASSVPTLIVPIPASSVVSLNLGTMGHRFATGIAHAITNLVGDTDATAVAAAQVKVILDYI